MFETYTATASAAAEAMINKHGGSFLQKKEAYLVSKSEKEDLEWEMQELEQKNAEIDGDEDQDAAS